MDIPGLLESLAMLDHKRPQSIDFMGPKAVGFRESDRLQPKFRNTITLLNVDVRRFSSFKAIEEKPESRHA
jgi:hypothetical protein